jgi:hypothetical protein
MPSALTSIAIQIVAGKVTAVGDPVTDDSAVVNEWVVRVLVALVVGGMLNLIVGFVRSEIAKKRSK